MSVKELYALTQPETLIENLLSAQDVTVLAAKPKAGKTNLVVGMLAETSTGLHGSAPGEGTPMRLPGRRAWLPLRAAAA